MSSNAGVLWKEDGLFHRGNMLGGSFSLHRIRVQERSISSTRSVFLGGVWKAYGRGPGDLDLASDTSTL